MLEIMNLETGYGDKQILFGVTLQVRQNEIVALIGPNGAGKSTVLKAIYGIIPTFRGKVLFSGNPMTGHKPGMYISKGISYAPQGNRVFDDLTVMENLEVGGYSLPSKSLRDRIQCILESFPELKPYREQYAGKLSGGEQQLLALARTLIPAPKLLLLDEPSLGLSPKLVTYVLNKLVELNKTIGVSILIVEQKVREVLAISNRVYSLRQGRISFDGAPGELGGDKDKLRQLFL